MQIGSTGGGITMDSNGDATFNSTITIGASLAASISGSANEFSSSAFQVLQDSKLIHNLWQNSVQLTSTGLNVLDGSGNAIAQFGDTVTIGEDKDNNSRIFIDNNSVDLIVDSGGTDTELASFGATTTIGSTSGEHVSISSTAVEIKTDANTTGLICFL